MVHVGLGAVDSSSVFLKNSPKIRLNSSGLSILELWAAFVMISKGLFSRSAHCLEYVWTLPVRSASPQIIRIETGKTIRHLSKCLVQILMLIILLSIR